MSSLHYHKSPDLITEEELRQYFLYLKNVKHYVTSSTAGSSLSLSARWKTLDHLQPGAPAACAEAARYPQRRGSPQDSRLRQGNSNLAAQPTDLLLHRDA